MGCRCGEQHDERSPPPHLVSDGCGCLLWFRFRRRGWSRLSPRRNSLVSLGCCTSVQPNLYRSGSAIGAQSLTSGISGARRAASWSGRRGVPPPHVRIHGQTHGRRGRVFPAHHALGLSETTLTRPRRPRRRQTKLPTLFAPEADAQARGARSHPATFSEPWFKGLSGNSSSCLLAILKTKFLSCRPKTLDKAFSSTPSKPPPRNPALRA